MRCETEKFSIGRFFVEKNGIDIEPPYQRIGGAWGRDKKELFLDTLFRGYDLPKIYMHKLKDSSLCEYALVDGKQRLECIWEFLGDGISLGADFDFSPTGKNQEQNKPYPAPGDKYSNLSIFWKEQFKALSLDVVLIHEAEESDIEELFSRLNNGEQLNAAEKRNAMGGTVRDLIRKIPEHKFFTDTFPTPNGRYLHHELAARFLLMEKGKKDGSSSYRTLKKRFLDALVRDNKDMKEPEIAELESMVSKQLNVMMKIFNKKDPLLKKAGHPQLYYLFAKEMCSNYANEKLFSQLQEFISYFNVERTKSLKLTPDQKTSDEGNKDKYSFLDAFERLMQQGNDENSLLERVSIMRRFFLLMYPKTKLLDKIRNFSIEERYVIYIRDDKKCKGCNKIFLDFGGFEADHVDQHAHGGHTTLDNAQALCIECNRKKNKKVA